LSCKLQKKEPAKGKIFHPASTHFVLYTLFKVVSENVL